MAPLLLQTESSLRLQRGGSINRGPADMRADGSVYYFQDTSHGTAYAWSVMLQLVDDSALKAEYVNGICPSAPMFSNLTTYSYDKKQEISNRD